MFFNDIPGAMYNNGVFPWADGSTRPSAPSGPWTPTEATKVPMGKMDLLEDVFFPIKNWIMFPLNMRQFPFLKRVDFCHLFFVFGGLDGSGFWKIYSSFKVQPPFQWLKAINLHGDSSKTPPKEKSIQIPWKSKTKQRMVFGMNHVKDSLQPMGKVRSLDFLGIHTSSFNPLQPRKGKSPKPIKRNSRNPSPFFPRNQWQGWQSCHQNLPVAMPG